MMSAAMRAASAGYYFVNSWVLRIYGVERFEVARFQLCFGNNDLGVEIIGWVLTHFDYYELVCTLCDGPPHRSGAS